MAENTKIEWTDATWNPITGCSVTSPGCKHCYAMQLAGTRLKHHESRAGLTQDTSAGPVWTGEVRFNSQWLDQPLHWKAPKMIFVCAHADLFHESVPDEWIDKIFAVMALSKRHIFQVLTKRAKRMREYFSALTRDRIEEAAREMGYTFRHCGIFFLDFPLPNVWIGVSVEDQKRADERIPELMATPAAVRWVSAEPLLGAVDLKPWVYDRETEIRRAMNGPAACNRDQAEDSIRKPLDWVVVGGESGRKARPMHPHWARELRDQCAAAGVPFLFKQWGAWSPRALICGAGHDFQTIDPQCKRWPDVIRLGEHGRDTRITENCTPDSGQEVYVQRVGKKSAGRLLDGVLHDGYPELSA